MPESDNGDTERNRITKTSPLKIPKRELITFGFMTCARAAGKSVRECACMLKGGGWLECPPEFKGVLARPEAAAAAAEWTARLPPVMLPTVFTPPDNPEKFVAPYPVSSHAGDAMPYLRGPHRPDPEPIGDLGAVPKTPEEITAAVAAERTQLRNAIGGKSAGFTGNICGNCQSTRMVRNGVCETCLDCFHSGECG